MTNLEPILPSGVALRTATAADLDAIYAVARGALVFDRFSREFLAEKLFADRRAGEFQWSVLIAENNDGVQGFLQSAARPATKKAWIGLFAVAVPFRRRGVGRALHATAMQSLPEETSEIEALAIPCNYMLPGLDPRHTEALAFLESLGYQRFSDCVNMTADLDAEFDPAPAVEALRRNSILIRRATSADAKRLDAFFGAHFGEGWRFECELALKNDPPSLHLALKNDRIIGFSAHSTQNREWGFFGPMGTTPECRGQGVGRVLLWMCLNDLRVSGHRSAVIPWVGPIAFYHRWAGCRVDRVFWRFRLTLPAR